MTSQKQLIKAFIDLTKKNNENFETELDKIEKLWRVQLFRLLGDFSELETSKEGQKALEKTIIDIIEWIPRRYKYIDGLNDPDRAGSVELEIIDEHKLRVPDSFSGLRVESVAAILAEFEVLYRNPVQQVIDISQDAEKQYQLWHAQYQKVLKWKPVEEMARDFRSGDAECFLAMIKRLREMDLTFHEDQRLANSLANLECN